MTSTSTPTTRKAATTRPFRAGMARRLCQSPRGSPDEGVRSIFHGPEPPATYMVGFSTGDDVGKRAGPQRRLPGTSGAPCRRSRRAARVARVAAAFSLPRTEGAAVPPGDRPRPRGAEMRPGWRVDMGERVFRPKNSGWNDAAGGPSTPRGMGPGGPDPFHGDDQPRGWVAARPGRSPGRGVVRDPEPPRPPTGLDDPRPRGAFHRVQLLPPEHARRRPVQLPAGASGLPDGRPDDRVPLRDVHRLRGDRLRTLPGRGLFVPAGVLPARHELPPDHQPERRRQRRAAPSLPLRA